MRKTSPFNQYTRFVAMMKERPDGFENSMLAGFSAMEQPMSMTIATCAGVRESDLGWFFSGYSRRVVGKQHMSMNVAEHLVLR